MRDWARLCFLSLQKELLVPAGTGIQQRIPTLCWVAQSWGGLEPEMQEKEHMKVFSAVFVFREEF